MWINFDKTVAAATTNQRLFSFHRSPSPCMQSTFQLLKRFFFVVGATLTSKVIDSSYLFRCEPFIIVLIVMRVWKNHRKDIGLE